VGDREKTHWLTVFVAANPLDGLEDLLVADNRIVGGAACHATKSVDSAGHLNLLVGDEIGDFVGLEPLQLDLQVDELLLRAEGVQVEGLGPHVRVACIRIPDQDVGVTVVENFGTVGSEDREEGNGRNEDDCCHEHLSGVGGSTG